MLVVVRRPSGRVSECSRVRSAKKAEEGLGSHQCPKIVSRIFSFIVVNKEASIAPPAKKKTRPPLSTTP